MTRTVEFGWEIGPRYFTKGLLMEQFLERGLVSVVTEGWTTDAEALDPVEAGGFPARTLARGGAHRYGEVLLEFPSGALAAVMLDHGSLSVLMGLPEQVSAAPVLAEIERVLPRAEPGEEQVVWVHFWALSPNGPEVVSRKIEVPQWPEVRGNYGEATLEGLDPLMDGFRPGTGGQLVLWSGDPGTGKTFALRALAWEWRSWCEIHYIADPDSFFGKAAYMLRVLLGSAEDERWRLLVLEDTGELIRPDAKAETGQGLSRLLNVVDGLIGQGLRIMVLITTNEERRVLHPAVVRPGRCAAHVEFGALSAEEAARWMEARGAYPERVEPKEHTLAELHDLLEERRSPRPKPQPVGFGVGDGAE